MIYCIKQGRSTDSNRGLNPSYDRHLSVLTFKFSLTDIYLFEMSLFLIIISSTSVMTYRPWSVEKDLLYCARVWVLKPNWPHFPPALVSLQMLESLSFWTWNIPIQFPPLLKIGVEWNLKITKSFKGFVYHSMTRMWKFRLAKNPFYWNEFASH